MFSMNYTSPQQSLAPVQCLCSILLLLHDQKSINNLNTRVRTGKACTFAFMLHSPPTPPSPVASCCSSTAAGAGQASQSAGCAYIKKRVRMARAKRFRAFYIERSFCARMRARFARAKHQRNHHIPKRRTKRTLNMQTATHSRIHNFVCNGQHTYIRTNI